jgi:hypothetical protein
MNDALLPFRTNQFLALILDNEVTVGEFVTNPPLPWIRLVQRDSIFKVAGGYPNTLTAAQAKFEMTNWDQVSLPAIARALAELDAVDYVLIGNNAGQGLPLAQNLAPRLISDRAAVIYAQTLPEISAYRELGYRTFFRRSEAASRLGEFARNADRPLVLTFVNTIQHNEFNYHHP